MSYKRSALYPPTPSTTRGSSTRISAHKEKIVYTNGKSVIIRDLNDPAVAVAYTGHTQLATVARISPSGYYCASGDATGTVRVWDTVGEDQTLKGEYKVISGKINDLEWDGESKRILAVGDGREKFGHAFMFDSGSSSGVISGHSKIINAVSIRHQRPFRAATASDDCTIVFYQGVPYKFDKTIKTHTKFVQDVRYAASGDHFASVGSDAKVFLYDGKTGDVLGEFEGEAHKGTITACSWSPDDKTLATSSADTTVKLWDVETRKCTLTIPLGTGLHHQQVGTTYTSTSLVSLSLSGALNVLDPRAGSVARVLRGPQKAITAASPAGEGTFLAGTADGRVIGFDSAKSEYEDVGGSGHTNLVAGIAQAGDKVVSVGYDDTVREIGGTEFVPASASTAGQPRGVALGPDGSAFVVGIGGIEVFRDNQRVHALSPSFAPSSVDVSQDVVVVGGEDSVARVYKWDGKELKEESKLEGNKGPVFAVAISPDGTKVASGDSMGKIILFDLLERKLITGRWSFHTARINSLAWTADSQHLASGSLDTHVYIWSVAKPLRNIALKNAGPGGVNAVWWVAPNKVASAGADAAVRVWEVTFHT